jgi:hypothetical protein
MRKGFQSCAFQSHPLEKHIVRRTRSLIRDRRLMSVLSMVCHLSKDIFASLSFLGRLHDMLASLWTPASVVTLARQ